MNWKRGLGIALIFIGIFIIATARVLTGAVVGTKPENFLGWLGIWVFIVGIILIFMAKKRLEESIREAIKEGVPLTEAEKIFNETNKKVERGEWVELRAFRVRDTAEPKTYTHGTSLCRYWGPPEYKTLSGRKLDDLYKQGKIGKTHEVVRGSDKYKIGGSLAKGTISMPPKGARVLHRHWKIAQMYDYKKHPRK